MNSGRFTQKHETKIDFKDNKSLSYLTYSSWRSMLYRCLKDSKSSYFGMSIDESWLDFDLFVRDMGERLSSKHQLDRIDNTKGYFKTNCR